MNSTRKLKVGGWLAGFAAAVLQLGASANAASAPRVLQVGSYAGHRGAFNTIQAAVNAARPGDWILIAPGDYHEAGSDLAGVYVTTPGIHLRGMDRSHVIVDGTLPGSAPCSSDPAAQNFGTDSHGRNGIEVFKVDGVSIENLTVCNFMGDVAGSQGNQIWWNGGDGSGQIGMGNFSGAYLTATSSFYQPNANLAQYGIFASNARGPGLIEHSYASNMSDSAFYVGGCADCNTTLRFVHAQNSAQGFSGSNAGGRLVLEYSEWDGNQSGIVPSSLAVDDLPSPQDGACPGNPPQSCTLIQYNYVHDNNNPNTPAAGLAATVPVGTGIDLTGGRNNTVRGNSVVRNGAWGILLNDYPDYSASNGDPAYCSGGIQSYTPPAPYDQLYAPNLPIPCYFQSFGNQVTANVLQDNGFFGNATNGDLANAALPYASNNCFDGNVNSRTGAPSSAPRHLQNPAVAGVCGRPWKPAVNQEILLTEQLGCASVGLCAGLPPPLYPTQTQVLLLPLAHEPGLPEACAGVPRNSWCPR